MVDSGLVDSKSPVSQSPHPPISPTPLLYTHPQLHPGILVKRYKRFLADIQLDTGESIVAHCPNTGPMTGVCQIGAPVQVSFHDNPKRKLAYTWEMIYMDDVWIGINTALPNKLIKLALEQRLFPDIPLLRHRPGRAAVCGRLAPAHARAG